MDKERREGIFLFLIVMLMGLFIFKDTGVFVNDYTKDGMNFKDGEFVEIIRTKDAVHTVLKDKGFYEIPAESLLKITTSGQKYKTLRETKVYSNTLGTAKDLLPSGTLLTLKKVEGDYGLFTYSGDFEGYLLFSDLEEVEESYVTPAVLLKDTQLNNGKKEVYLKAYSTVYVNNYKDGIYTIQDNENNHFSVGEGLIKLASDKERKELASRASYQSKASGNAAKLIEFGKAQIGKRYSYGSAGPNVFDCSGFTSYVYRNVLGISLNRSSRGQSSNGVKVSKSELQPGDLVFFNTMGNGISHVGMYIGNGQFIHSSSTNHRGVRIDYLSSGYYSGRYVTARRILK